MNAFLARQLRDITAALEITGGRLITSVIFALLAILALLAGLAFLAVALFLKIAALAGTVYAALAVGGAFIVTALLALIVLRLRRPKAPKPTPVEAEKAARHAALAANIDETIAPVLTALHDANMKPEELALRVGAELSKQAGGFGLIALAVAAGFVVARQVSGGKKP